MDRDFVVIEMVEIMDRDQLIENALNRMKGFNVLSFLYYILSYYLVFLQKYCITFKAKTILVADKKEYRLDGPFTITLFNDFLFFKCMESEFEIKLPYEYLIRFWVTNIDHPEQLAQHLRKHLLYHMKYNKIKMEVVDYYLSLTA
jgi:hypothetical protein